MPANLEIVVDSHLAQYIRDKSGLEASLYEPDVTAKTQALECGLETLAAIVTIAAGTATLTEISINLTKSIKKWLDDRKIGTTPLIFRGDADDTALNFTPETKPTEVEKAAAMVSSSRKN